MLFGAFQLINSIAYSLFNCWTNTAPLTLQCLCLFTGAFLGCVGCYQLWKIAPSTFVDVTLAFLFYKLSIVSSELHQHRKSNSLTTRLKFGTPLRFLIAFQFILKTVSIKKCHVMHKVATEEI
jgi:hypothetical protein